MAADKTATVTWRFFFFYVCTACVTPEEMKISFEFLLERLRSELYITRCDIDITCPDQDKDETMCAA